MAYDVRDTKGDLVMRVNNDMARAIMNRVKGYFRPHRNQPSVTVFQIDSDWEMNVGVGTVYLWKGTILIPADM